LSAGINMSNRARMIITEAVNPEVNASCTGPMEGKQITRAAPMQVDSPASRDKYKDTSTGEVMVL
jgi:hypothetical protein